MENDGIMKFDAGLIDIKPCNSVSNIETSDEFIKLDISEGQKLQLDGFVAQLPMLASAGAMSNLYTVSFPEGLPQTLTKLRQGGLSTAIKGKDGKFVGSASLFKADDLAMIFGVFSVMSAITMQYYLNDISSRLKKLELGIDKILEFLYGDKKAELMAEVSFARLASQNYNSIMSCYEQRISTINSLQDGKKVAMKNIEFYMSDLDGTLTDKSSVDILVHKAMRTKECLDLSLQLFALDGLLEVYYAQNFDSGYLSYIEKEITTYISKCERRIISDFSSLKVLIGKQKDSKIPIAKAIDKEALTSQINKVTATFDNGNESELAKEVREAFCAPLQKKQYYISKGGNVYTKKAFEKK